MHPMELLGDLGHVESRFGPFGDSVSVEVPLQDMFTVCTKRTTGSEIVLEAPDGTPR
jgi:hypothetical protein